MNQISYNTMQSRNTKKKTIILVAILLITILGGASTFYMYNKQSKTVSYSQTPTEATMQYVASMILNNNYDAIKEVSSQNVTAEGLNKIKSTLDPEKDKMTGFTIHEARYIESEKVYLAQVDLVYEGDQYRTLSISMSTDKDTLLVDGLALAEKAAIPVVAEKKD